MVAMATAFKESQNFYQKFIFGMKANFYAKFEANLRTSTYHPLHDFYMNLYLNGGAMSNSVFQPSDDENEIYYRFLLNQVLFKTGTTGS